MVFLRLPENWKAGQADIERYILYYCGNTRPVFTYPDQDQYDRSHNVIDLSFEGLRSHKV
jgi:hypothetical protein